MHSGTDRSPLRGLLPFPPAAFVYDVCSEQILVYVVAQIMTASTIPAMTPGIHLLHKPVGPTSFSLVQAAMQAANTGPGQKRVKVCHGGTLDPFAHGLLLMLVGSATRLFEHLHAIPKVYEATVRFGRETDNGDLHGRTVFEGDPSGLSPQQLDDALATFVGWHEQTPHATSAKRIGGERAYLKAHRGEAVEMPPSRVYLHDAKWLSHDLPR
jgi:tRNA pseudouridine55 synthase